jgi:hypothetical protein
MGALRCLVPIRIKPTPLILGIYPRTQMPNLLLRTASSSTEFTAASLISKAQEHFKKERWMDGHFTLSEALRVAQESADAPNEAFALGSLGNMHDARGDIFPAITHWQKGKT